MSQLKEMSSVPLRIAFPPTTPAALRAWWQDAGGYREVLQLAWPLVLSQGTAVLLQLTDRMFLTWYSPTAMAATGSAGMLAFTVQSLFLGLVGYSATFVAQYIGAGKPRQAIAVAWQALYLAIAAALLVLTCIPLGGWLFQLAGHSAEMQRFERTYFSIFLSGSFAFIGMSAISAYFIGRGLTQIVLWVNLVGVALNIPLGYLCIFGGLGVPAMGVGGAALAAVLAQGVALLTAFAFFAREARASHAAGAWHIDVSLLGRMLRFGTAGGAQFMLDVMSWTCFLLLMGHLGATALAATNLAIQLNSLAFLPILGIGMASSTLVGQNLGHNRPDLANRAVWSSLHLGLLFTLAVDVLFLTIPAVMLAPFGMRADPVEFAPVRDQAIMLLRFISAYLLFDSGNIIFALSLKGAGDTLFVMLLSTGIQVTVMLLPTLLWCVNPGGLGLYGAWIFLTLTVLILSAAFLLRYLSGHWRSMRVIEHEAVVDELV